jgi:iron(III) transport system substrate-binding protein
VSAARDKGERELNLVWGQQSLGGDAGARKFEALFNRMYRTSVRFSFTPGPPMAVVAGRVSQEVAARQTPLTDVLLGTGSTLAPFVNRRVLEEYAYTRLSPRIGKEFLAPSNTAVEVGSFVTGITYNTDHVRPTEAPRRVEDLLNPKWKGRIASTPYAAHFEALAVRPEWGREKLLEFVAKLSPHLGGLLRCGENQRITSGEFIMLGVDCGSYYVRLERAKGAPLAQVLPENGSGIFFWYMGVPQTAGNPNLAKLFINTVLSPDGQRLFYELWATDHYALPGSQSAGELKELQGKGIEPSRVDAKVMAERPELTELTEQIVKALRAR